MQTVKQAVFIGIRGVAILVLLVWMLVSLSNSAEVGLLLLFAAIVLFWFCFSILVDFIWPASGNSGIMRQSAFGMIDVYIAVSFLIVLHNMMISSVAVIAIYCLVVTYFHGPVVGIVSAMAGVLGACNSRGLDVGSGFLPLVIMFAAGIAGVGFGLLAKTLQKRIEMKAAGRGGSAGTVDKNEEKKEAPVIESREELLGKVKIMQDNFSKVCEERDQLQEQIAELEDKLRKEE